MLIYHPAFDAYHCVFRMLLLIDSLSEAEVEVEMLRLLDFYLVFPSEIGNIRLPAGLSYGRKISKTSSNVYRDPINAKQAFRDMSEIQLASLRNIAAFGVLDIDSYERGLVKRRDSVGFSSDIKRHFNLYSGVSQEVLEFIVSSLSRVPLRGVNGLKHRTELLEYKYDTP